MYGRDFELMWTYYTPKLSQRIDASKDNTEIDMDGQPIIERKTSWVTYTAMNYNLRHIILIIHMK